MLTASTQIQGKGPAVVETDARGGDKSQCHVHSRKALNNEGSLDIGARSIAILSSIEKDLCSYMGNSLIHAYESRPTFTSSGVWALEEEEEEEEVLLCLGNEYHTCDEMKGLEVPKEMHNSCVRCTKYIWASCEHVEMGAQAWCGSFCGA